MMLVSAADRRCWRALSQRREAATDAGAAATDSMFLGYQPEQVPIAAAEGPAGGREPISLRRAGGLLQGRGATALPSRWSSPTLDRVWWACRIGQLRRDGALWHNERTGASR